MARKWSKPRGKLTSKERQHLPKSDFALPGKGEGKKGVGPGSYPIPDESHARNALARVSQHGSSEEKSEVRAKVHSKYPEIGAKKPKLRAHQIASIYKHSARTD